MYVVTFYGRHTAQHLLKWSQITLKNEFFKSNESTHKKEYESYYMYIVSANKS